MPIVKLSVFGKSEQVTTTGANIFDANSVKSYTEGLMEIRNNKNGTITFKGTNNSEFPTNYNLDKNGKIVLSAGYWTVSVDGLEKCSLVIQTKDNKIFKELKSGSFTFDNPVEQGLTFFLIQCKAGETVEETVSVYLEKGNNALKEPYTGGKPSPSPEYPQEIAAKEFKDIKIHGKNLLGGKYYYVSYSLGVGFIKEDTFNQEPIFPYTPAEEVKGVGKTMYCKKGTTYTLSVTNANSNYAISIAEYASVEDTKNKDKCIGNARVSSTDRISYTALNDGILLCYIAGKWTDGTTTIHTCTDTELLQVEIGETATAYEPYTEQTFSLSEPVTLNALKVDVNGNYTDETGQQWITDEIDLARGKYVQRIAKYVFDGSEELADNIGSKTSYFLKVNDIRSNTGMCNYGKRIPVTGQKQEELTFCVDDNGIYLYTTKAVNEFKNLLKQKYDSGKPVEVLYALKTPIETDLPPETIAAFKKLHTNYHTTIVSNNADAGMELTYTVDTQSYIDSKIAEVSKALL